MEMKELLEKFDALENRVAELEEQNAELKEQVEESNGLDVKRLADSIQKWIVEEYSQTVQAWITEEFAPAHTADVVAEAVDASKEMFVNEMADKIQSWVVEEFAPEVQNWIIEEYSPTIQDYIIEEFAPEVQNWCVESFAPGIQNWIINEYAPEVEKFMNENFMETVKNRIAESITESKKNSLSSIDETLKVLESIEATKPTYSRKAIITENATDEPLFVRNMPADARVKWEMASEGVKESITRRAKLYDFTNEGAIDRFWANVDFSEVKPINNVYEGLETVVDEKERAIRASLRSWRSRKA
jgi:hypothetical protein